VIRLLDVNILIALIDRKHVHHHIAASWFRREGQQGWASCPITENGVLRIVGHPRYQNTPGSPVVVSEVLRELRQVGNHQFWADDISLLVCPAIEPAALTSHRNLTDSYLLALAATKGGLLATLDARLSTEGVRGGASALQIVPAS
jgi:toxin-antitoxin system PIN domain toxin